MDRVEALLHDTLSDKAGMAPIGPIRLDAATRRWVPVAVTAVAASLLVALVAVGVVILTGAGHGTETTAPPSHDHRLPIPSALPAGERLASYGAVSLLVPADLPTRTSLCGSSVNDVVIAPDDTAVLCPVVADGLSKHPGIVVWFSSYGQTSPYRAIRTAPAPIAGLKAEQGFATNVRHLGTGVSAVVKLPNQRVIVGITAGSRTKVNHLLSSIRAAAINPLGCAARFSAATKLPAGSSTTTVAAGADAAIRCEYSSSGREAGTLIGSYRLGHSSTTQVADALNDLKPDPCHCLHSGTASPGRDEVIYLHDRKGWAQRITGMIGDNLDNYTNGKRVVANYSGSIASLIARLSNQH